MVDTVYIGGGTPGIVPVNTLYDFLDKLKKISGTPLEVTIEMNPETVSKETLQRLNDTFITRLSLGVQSFSDQYLSILGRNTDAASTLKAVEAVKNFWSGDLNLDLITSIPGEDTAGAALDVSTAAAFNPDHISVYTLTYESGTELFSKIKKGDIVPVDEKTDLDITNKVISILADTGFERYEVSNFSKKNKRSLHNLHYWRMDPYFGAGPSAVSTISVQNRPVRLSFPGNVKEYLSGADSRMDIESISNSDFLTDIFLMGLRVREGISMKRIQDIFQLDPAVFLAPVSEKWKEHIKTDHDRVYLSPGGINLMNSILLDISIAADQLGKKFEETSISWP